MQLSNHQNYHQNFYGIYTKTDKEKIIMNHKELFDKVSDNLFKESGRIESRNSWLVIRNYLEQLDDLQLMEMLKNKN